MCGFVRCGACEGARATAGSWIRGCSNGAERLRFPIVIQRTTDIAPPSRVYPGFSDVGQIGRKGWTECRPAGWQIRNFNLTGRSCSNFFLLNVTLWRENFFMSMAVTTLGRRVEKNYWSKGFNVRMCECVWVCMVNWKFKAWKKNFLTNSGIAYYVPRGEKQRFRTSRYRRFSPCHVCNFS